MFVVSVVFAYIVMSDGLMAMKYTDDDGKYHSVGIRILTQVIVLFSELTMIIMLIPLSATNH